MARQKNSSAWFLALVLAQFLLGSVVTQASAEGANIHTIFLTECSMYFEWQTLGVMYTHKKIGQPGPITRVMCCTDDQRKELKQEYIDLAPTHFAPSYTVHPVSGDIYSAYNKPLAVIDYMEKNYDKIQEDFVLVMDADMLFRLPMIPAELGVKQGWATGAQFGFLEGVKNALAERHIPHVKPRNNKDGGQPYGRKADQIGAYIVMQKDDLKKMSRDWLKYTEDVRADVHAWNETGDQYATHPGDKPWISEMYGYVFAAANNDIWHIADRTSMLYPEYVPIEPPRIIHYGLYYEIDNYEYDKHWFLGFDPLVCPPWDMTTKKPQYGLFPHPPRPSELKAYGRKKGMQLMKDLLGIETVTTLNVAFCENYMKMCPPSEQLKEECAKAKEIEMEVQREYEKMDAIPFGDKDSWCRDTHDNCMKWSNNGECANNPAYMQAHCQMACGKCRSVLPPKLAASPEQSQTSQIQTGEKQEVDEEDDAPAVKKEDNFVNLATDQAVQDISISNKDMEDAESGENLQLKQKCLSVKSLTALQVGECVKAAEKGEDYMKTIGMERDQTIENTQEVFEMQQVNQQSNLGVVLDASDEINSSNISYGFILVGVVLALFFYAYSKLRRRKRLARAD